MADLKALTEEMKKLQSEIEDVLYISNYREYDDLSGLKNYKQIKGADQRQLLEEYRRILYKLDDIQCDLAYLSRPVKEVSKLHLNESGRYETAQGHYYTSGSSIEFLRTEETYNHDTDEWEDTEIWTCSRVEHNGQDYYIVGYANVELLGLTVRTRG